MNAPKPALLSERRVIVPDLSEPPRRWPQARRVVLEGRAFATAWRLIVLVTGEIDGLHGRCQAALDTIDRQMSPYRADSDLTRFNTAADWTFVALPEPLTTVLHHATAMAALTGGAFDPAILPAVELWGFGARAVAEGLPDDADIAGLRAQGHGWRDLIWQPDGLIKPQDVRIDLCGIAKGYAADVLMDLLKAEPGVVAALVEVGGELKGWGVQPDGLPWWVELESPAGANAPPFIAALCDWAVATSGDGQRAFTHGGRLYAHTLDNRTQAPAQSDIASATVFDAEGWRADALATALIVMGSEQALAFAAAHDIPCLLWVRDGAGVVERLSPRLTAWA